MTIFRTAFTGNISRAIFSCLLLMGISVPGFSARASQPETKEGADIFATMSPQQRQQTGVDTLSPAQKQALGAWLRDYLAKQAAGRAPTGHSPSGTRHQANEAEVEKEVQRRVAEKLAKARADSTGREKSRQRQPVTARIAGKFKGWRGGTEFYLDNGQIWKQVGGETYYIRAMQDPEVELVPMALGSWGLRIKATGRTVKVRRIR